MIDHERAVALASEHLSAMPALADGDTLVLLAEHTIERPFGWVFFYSSRLWVETGDFRYALGGNAPFIVDRHSGEITLTGTARPVEEFIAEHEARLRR